MRVIAAALLGLALSACGGDGGALAAGNSELSQAQIDAALGPADQTMVEDALPTENLEDGDEPAANVAEEPAGESEE